MSYPAWQLFLGSRALLVYTIGSQTETFGHGQRLRDLTVTRNYAPIYTIGTREMTAVPYGQFRVSWGVDVAFSNISILCLVFNCSQQSGQQGTVITGTTLYEPVHFDINAYLQSGSTVKKLTLSRAVVMDMTISAESGRAEVSASLSGIARDIAVADETSAPSIQLPGRMFNFAGAKLYTEAGTELPATRAEISIRQGGDAVYRIGDDRFAAVYLGEYEVTASVEIPLSNVSLGYLSRLLANENLAGISLELRSCTDALCGDASPATVRFTTEGRGAITDYRAPVSDIGLNTATIDIRFSRVVLQVTM